MSKLLNLEVTPALNLASWACVHSTGKQNPLINEIGICVTFNVRVEKLARSPNEPFWQPDSEPRSFKACIDERTITSC